MFMHKQATMTCANPVGSVWARMHAPLTKVMAARSQASVFDVVVKGITVPITIEASRAQQKEISSVKRAEKTKIEAVMSEARERPKASDDNLGW